MYDKFRSFVEEMEKIGKQLATCHATYDGAFLKLTRGRGNLVAHAEQLRELGVQIKKEMPKSITDIAECRPGRCTSLCVQRHSSVGRFHVTTKADSRI